ncbi:MAG TPA: glycosyltransferase family 39 protein [Bacteroidota bacterium]|nr:glycosyltransferase family 39 protein [Bacteroidota bacterium]
MDRSSIRGKHTGSPAAGNSAGGYFSSPRVRLAILVLLSISIIFSKLGGSGLANYDDCFYAQKAKEILQTGDWMTMHFNNMPAWENPPFFMWLIALSFKIFGVNEFAAKFPSALFGVATVLFITVIARKLYTSWVAFFSSLVLATTFIFTRYARHAMMDVTLTFFVCLAVYALLMAIEGKGKFFILWGLCISVCMLIKSVLGLYPLFLTITFLLLTGRWRILFSPYFLFGSLIGIGLGSAWYVDQYARFGRQFIDAHFGWVIYTRGFNLESQSWTDHLTYLEDLAKYYWPWLPLFAVSVVLLARRAWRKDSAATLIVLWSCLILVVMSLMQSRVLWYIMPMFPAAAIGCGYVADRYLNERMKLVITGSVGVITIAVAVVLNATPVRIEAERSEDVRELAPYVKQFKSQGARVIAFRQDYYGLNNSLLFYSDVAAFPLYENVDLLVNEFKSASLVVCVVPKDAEQEVLAKVPNVYFLETSGDLSIGINRSFQR